MLLFDRPLTFVKRFQQSLDFNFRCEREALQKLLDSIVDCTQLRGVDDLGEVKYPTKPPVLEYASCYPKI